MYSQIKHYICIIFDHFYIVLVFVLVFALEKSQCTLLSLFLSVQAMIISVHQTWTWTTGLLTSAFDLFACVYINGSILMCLLFTASATTNYSSVADCCWLPVHWCVDFSIYVGRNKPSGCWWPGGCATWSDLAAGQQHRASDHAAHPG